MGRTAGAGVARDIIGRAAGRPSETQKIGVSDGLFSRNLFGIILGSLGIIIVELVAKKPHCSGALC